ncbi:hypothetical protein [Geoglobus ahangari]
MEVPLLARLVTLRNVHPILTHMSNGLTPAAFFFSAVSLLLDIACLREASYYMMLVVGLITPFTMLAGVVDWKYRYDFKRFQLMDRKIVTAVVGYVFVIAYLTTESILALALALLFFAITGEYGGRLVHGAVNSALVRKYRAK